MKHIALAATLLVLGLASSAHADGYASAGVALGANLGTTTGWALDTGYHLGDTKWIGHAELGGGQIDDLSEVFGGSESDPFAYGQSHYLRVRAGVAREHYTSTRRWCGFYGLDVGGLGTSATSGPRGDSLSAQYRQLQVVGRVGGDVGSQHVRVRLTLSNGFGITERTRVNERKYETGFQGAELQLALVYRF